LAIIRIQSQMDVSSQLMPLMMMQLTKGKDDSFTRQVFAIILLSFVTYALTYTRTAVNYLRIVMGDRVKGAMYKLGRWTNKKFAISEHFVTVDGVIKTTSMSKQFIVLNTYLLKWLERNPTSPPYHCEIFPIMTDLEENTVIIFENSTSSVELTEVNLKVTQRNTLTVRDVVETRHNDDKIDGGQKETRIICYDLEILDRARLKGDITPLMFIKQWLDDMIAAREKSFDKYRHIMRTQPLENHAPTWESDFKFETSKTFDNTPCEHTAEIKRYIDALTDASSRYARTGISPTLGIMLHGPPGTGKTSIIKAIAKYTNRHIVSITFGDGVSRSTLNSVFMGNDVGQRKMSIPIDKILYVMEDVDCGSIADIVRSRLDAERPADPTGGKLTLSDLLEVIDGIVEMPGRIIIMTSNHPERLDPALLRPGRIDLMLKIDKLRAEDVAGVYQDWFGEAVPADVRAQMRDRAYALADLGQLFMLPDRADVHAHLASSRVASLASDSNFSSSNLSNYDLGSSPVDDPTGSPVDDPTHNQVDDSTDSQVDDPTDNQVVDSVGGPVN